MNAVTSRVRMIIHDRAALTTRLFAWPPRFEDRETFKAPVLISQYLEQMAGLRPITRAFPQPAHELQSTAHACYDCGIQFGLKLRPERALDLIWSQIGLEEPMDLAFSLKKESRTADGLRRSGRKATSGTRKLHGPRQSTVRWESIVRN